MNELYLMAALRILALVFLLAFVLSLLYYHWQDFQNPPSHS
jgi:hypothetical protein